MTPTPINQSIYVHTGGIEAPYRIPYSYKFNFDDSRKGVAKVGRVLIVGLLVHCKGEGNL